MNPVLQFRYGRRLALLIASHTVRCRCGRRIADGTSLLIALRGFGAGASTQDSGLPFLIVDTIFVLAAAVGLHLDDLVSRLVWRILDAIGGGRCA